MSLKRFSSFVAAIILAFSMVFGSIPMMTNAGEEYKEQAIVKVDASSISSFATDGTSAGTYIIAAKDSTGAYYALTKDMVYQSEVPDPETDSAYSFGKAEPIDVITDSSGTVTGVKANGEKIDNLKWICTYDSSEYYFWTSKDTSTRKQMFISSDPKGGIKIYPETRSVKYSDNVMSAKAKTGINYVIFKDAPDNYGLQFSGVLKEDGKKPDASYNTSIYLFKVAEEKAKTIEKVKKTAVKIKKPKTGKKKATAKWKANKLFNGYQVWYKMNAKGKKWKKVTVKGASKNKKVLKKLKKGKKYKIKVRGYKTIDGKKVYGKFSKTKTTGKIK